MHESPDDDVHDAPCACALVARAVTLMTEWAGPSPGHAGQPEAYRALLARQVMSDLYFLRSHPGLSPHLREAMAHAHQRWIALARPTSIAAQDTVMDEMSPGARGVSLH
ncbi:hypothetical protein [Variovorax rhizosphaerae]|uniref:Uncharacterized protein n=1 Tax=Variovorax rhizosphaerae TaxID=1836200 RepID=A0ABU8WIM0_9BURK